MDADDIEKSCYTCNHEYDCIIPDGMVCKYWTPDLDTTKLMEEQRRETDT